MLDRSSLDAINSTKMNSFSKCFLGIRVFICPACPGGKVEGPVCTALAMR